MQVFAPDRLFQQFGCEFAFFALVDFPNDTITAVEVFDQIQVKETPGDGAGQPGHIPCPDVVGRGGGMGNRFTSLLWGFGLTPVVQLVVGFQGAVEGGFAGDITPCVS